MELSRPLPVPTPTTQPFWDGVAQHQVKLQQCDDCQGWVFYPRTNCPHCLSSSLTWRDVTGEATIYSYTVAYRPTAPHFVDEIPQLIAVVELKEGVRMNTIIVNANPEELKVGLAVKPCFKDFFTDKEGQTLLCFEPA